MTDDIAMIQTVDFFTPIVDDPYMFGQIAAANSLSDVWAMGGEPAVALNIVGFPNCLDPAILGDILAGGADKVKEAGAVLVGGHSVQDDEPKYGLCVSGFVHPDKIFKNYGCRYIDSYKTDRKWYREYCDQSRDGIAIGNPRGTDGHGILE